MRLTVDDPLFTFQKMTEQFIMVSLINLSSLPDVKMSISAFGVPPFSGIQTLFDMSERR